MRGSERDRFDTEHSGPEGKPLPVIVLPALQGPTEELIMAGAGRQAEAVITDACRPDRETKRATPPGQLPGGAQWAEDGEDSGFDGVAVLPVLGFGRSDLEAHLLAHGPRQEAADRMWLPVGRFHELLQRGPVRTPEQPEDLSSFAPLTYARRLRPAGHLRGFGSPLAGGGLLPGLRLGWRNTGLPWRDIGLCGYFWRPS